MALAPKNSVANSYIEKRQSTIDERSSGERVCRKVEEAPFAETWLRKAPPEESAMSEELYSVSKECKVFPVRQLVL